MKIEAVTICVNYGGEFRETAQYNRPHFDRWIVVTRPNDHETIDLTKQYSCDLIMTDDFDRDGGFNKARSINRGLACVRGDGWLCHIDADIALPLDFKDVLNDTHLNENCIYGCDRLNVTGWENWQKVKSTPLRARSSPWCIELDRPYTKVGARVIKREYGYSPIGFFQLWHGPTQVVHGMPAKLYPIQHGTAARTDEQHSLQWDRQKRVLIPELLVWHLESTAAPMGSNWNGRSTPPFGPPSIVGTAAPSTQKKQYQDITDVSAYV